MKITAINPIICYGKLINWIFVKVETDEGLVGWGEATCEWKPKGVAGCVEDLSNLLIGQDPHRTEFLWQIMYRQYFVHPGIVGLAAVSGIDQACWDIHAQSLGVPLYQLLGGAVRDRVRMYAHFGGGDLDSIYHTETEEAYVEKARKQVAQGFTALKLLITGSNRSLDSLEKIHRAENVLRTLREALGEGVDLMLDFHGRTSPEMAIQYAKVLEPYYPFWMEEPCPPENVSGLARIARSTTVPLACGERIVLRQGFRPILESESVAVIQPDVCHTGGVTEMRKIAAMADAYNVAMAPHNPMGPIATAVNLHLAMATPNFLIQELFHTDVPWRDEVVDVPIQIIDGHAVPPTRPGLGIAVNEREAGKHPYQQDTVLRYFHEDGSVADW